MKYDELIHECRMSSERCGSCVGGDCYECNINLLFIASNAIEELVENSANDKKEIEWLKKCVDDLSKSSWVPITSRPMDEEERREWSEKLGFDIEYGDDRIYTSQLPDDGQEVLTCNRYGHIRMDTFNNDPEYGCCFEENGDMDGIVAWMPLPKPYKQ